MYFDARGVGIRPRLALEWPLEVASSCSINQCIVVTSPAKPELLRYIGDGSRYGLHVSFVVQEQPTGLADAVATALPWTSGAGIDTCLALPDTLFSPQSALQEVVAEVARANADLVLGVFPTDRPCELGPVDFGIDGDVYAVFDKPSVTSLRNTWGLCAWKPSFGRFFLDELQRSRSTPQSLGGYFDLACRAGLRVRAVYFGDGHFNDLGTPEGLAQLAAHSPFP